MTINEQINIEDYVSSRAYSEITHFLLAANKAKIIKDQQCMKLLEILDEKYWGDSQDIEPVQDKKGKEKQDEIQDLSESAQSQNESVAAQKEEAPKAPGIVTAQPMPPLAQPVFASESSAPLLSAQDSPDNPF